MCIRDSVIPLRALHALGEGEFQHLRMAAQLPDISLVSGKASAVDAALLASADADCLAALHIANGVRLRVFERYERQQQVVRRGVRELPVFCDDVGKAVAGDGQAVVALSLIHILCPILPRTLPSGEQTASTARTEPFGL